MRREPFVAARRSVVGEIQPLWRARISTGSPLAVPEDIVLALGQDGLVANVAKYLRG